MAASDFPNRRVASASLLPRLSRGSPRTERFPLNTTPRQACDATATTAANKLSSEQLFAVSLRHGSIELPGPCWVLWQTT